MPTHFQCLSGSNSAIRKAVVNPFESRNVPWLSEHNGPGGDFTTDRMCFAQLGHFSTLAKWSQVNANGARTVKTLSTILFMGIVELLPHAIPKSSLKNPTKCFQTR